LTRLADKPESQSLQEWAEMAEMTIDSYADEMAEMRQSRLDEKNRIRARVEELRAEEEACWNDIESTAVRLKEIYDEGEKLLEEALTLRDKK
jgi:hypothetical protein